MDYFYRKSNYTTSSIKHKYSNYEQDTVLSLRYSIMSDVYKL